MPDADSSLYTTLKANIAAIRAQYRAAVADGSVSFTEAKEICLAVIADLVKLAQIIGGTGPDKKAAVLQVFDEIIAELLAATDSPGPDAIVDRVLGFTAHQFADYAIDIAVSLFKRAGVLS